MPWPKSPAAFTTLSLPERRKWYRRVGLALGVLLVFSIWAAHGGRDGIGDDWAAFDRQQVTVKSIASDGTLKVCTPSGIEADARLLGIDLPRSEFPDSNAARGMQAVRWLAGEALGGTYTLRLEQPQTRSTDGALQVYLFADDSQCINQEIVRQGWAYADRRVPNTLRVPIEQAEVEAQKKARGIWKTLKEQEMPPWRQQWLQQGRERRQSVSGGGR